MTMTENQDATKVEEGVFPHSLNEYREKVGEIIRHQNEKFSQLAQEQAQEIIEGAWQKADEIVQKSQSQAEQLVAESRSRAEKIVQDSKQNALKISSDLKEHANQKAYEIVEDGKEKAQQLVQEAEDKIKREARDSMKAQKDKILAEAKEEADTIISEAKKEAEKKSNDIIGKMKQEAKENLEGEVTKFREDAKTQIAQIRSEAEKKAAALIEDIVNDSKSVNDMLIENISRSENILGKFKTELQSEIEELTTNTAKARQKLEQKTTRYSQTSQKDSPGPQIRERSNTDSALWVTLHGEQSAHKGDGSYLFKGQIEMKTLAQMDYLKIRKLKSFITQIPNMKYLGEVSGDEGIILTFDIKEPLPILDILNNAPTIQNVVAHGDSIKLILN